MLLKRKMESPVNIEFLVSVLCEVGFPPAFPIGWFCELYWSYEPINFHVAHV